MPENTIWFDHAERRIARRSHDAESDAARRAGAEQRLRQIIRDLQRHQFGRRAETLPEDQMLLGLEDVEQTATSDAAGADQAAARQAGAAKRRANRGALPAHLPRIETTIDLDDKTCLCCQGALHRIG